MRSQRSLACIGRSAPVAFLATTLEAQINRGAIEGIVTDPQGAVVPGVEVTVVNVDTNVGDSMKTNAAGYFRIIDLVPGSITANFQAAGFTPIEVTSIDAGAGRITRVDAQLRIDATRQTIEVAAEVPLVDTGASNFATTVETRAIQEVPLQGRDLQQLTFLIPGVNNVGGPPGSNFGFNSQFGTFPDPSNALGSNSP